MNLLTGHITWRPAARNAVEAERRFSNGNLDLHVSRTPSFCSGRRNIYHNPETEVTCAVIGYIANLEGIKAANRIREDEDVRVVARLYRLFGPRLIEHLEGVFSVFVWDGKRRKAYLFQDEYGSDLPLYYSCNDREVIFSGRLREILKRTAGERKLNLRAAREFLYFGPVIPNEATLVRGVHKLIRGHYLAIDLGKASCRLHKFHPKREKIDRASAKANLLQSVGNHVNALAAQLTNRRLACTLSGGFDTNLLLHFLARERSCELTAVTIGGRRVNEIPEAKICAAHYERVHHLAELVEQDGLDDFPEIVWRMEGYVFNPGLFLQLKLADTIQRNGIETAFLGECADQQLTSSHKRPWVQKLEHGIKRITRPTLLGQLYLRCMKKPKAKIVRTRYASFTAQRKFNISYDFVLKKSGIMLNSYGIQGVYPFLNRTTRAMAKAVGRLNRSKAFYKGEVRKLLTREQAECLLKTAGTTDIEYLLDGRGAVISELLNSGFVRNFLSERWIREISASPQEYAAFVLQLLYLYLFNEFFVTGKYDSRFDEAGPGETLGTLFGTAGYA